MYKILENWPPNSQRKCFLKVINGLPPHLSPLRLIKLHMGKWRLMCGECLLIVCKMKSKKKRSCSCLEELSWRHIFIQIVYNFVTLLGGGGGSWSISGGGLTVGQEDFLWLGAEVPLLGNGRGVTEGIPEHATKGSTLIWTAVLDGMQSHTNTQTNHSSQSSGALPSGLSQLKDWGEIQMLHSGCGLWLERRREQWKTGRRRTLMEGWSYVWSGTI